jgi:hypothetical protein
MRQIILFVGNVKQTLQIFLHFIELTRIIHIRNYCCVFGDLFF